MDRTGNAVVVVGRNKRSLWSVSGVPGHAGNGRRWRPYSGLRMPSYYREHRRRAGSDKGLQVLSVENLPNSKLRRENRRVEDVSAGAAAATVATDGCRMASITATAVARALS